MGRIGTDATTQETIDVEAPPPPEDDLYEPPSDYQRPKKLVTDHDIIKPRPNKAQPQPYEDDENATQSFPPAPRVNYEDDDFNRTQAFPPRPPSRPPMAAPPPIFTHHQAGAAPPPIFPHHQGGAGIPVQPGMPMLSPSPIHIQNQLPLSTHQPWKTHLFDCMKDPQNAIITACFPCVTFGQIAEILDSGGTSCATSGILYSLIAFCIAMPCLMSCGYRSKLRARFGLVESPAPDWLVHCFCEWCALCQEYRELQLRGLDPSIGWMGNVARQQQQQQMQPFGMTPPMQQRMM